MAEKNIQAFFESQEQAEEALSRVKGLGIVDASINAGDGSNQSMNSLISGIDGLGNLTVGGDAEDSSAGTLSADYESASGMSSGGVENQTTGRDIVLTVIVEEKDHVQALQILRHAGAIF